MICISFKLSRIVANNKRAVSKGNKKFYNIGLRSAKEPSRKAGRKSSRKIRSNFHERSSCQKFLEGPGQLLGPPEGQRKSQRKNNQQPKAAVAQ